MSLDPYMGYQWLELQRRMEKCRDAESRAKELDRYVDEIVAEAKASADSIPEARP